MLASSVSLYFYLRLYYNSNMEASPKRFLVWRVNQHLLAVEDRQTDQTWTLNNTQFQRWLEQQFEPQNCIEGIEKL